MAMHNLSQQEVNVPWTFLYNKSQNLNFYQIFKTKLLCSQKCHVCKYSQNGSPIINNFLCIKLDDWNGWSFKIIKKNNPALTQPKTFLMPNQFTYDYVKLYLGYFSNRFPVWEGIFTLNFFETCTSGTLAPDNI